MQVRVRFPGAVGPYYTTLWTVDLAGLSAHNGYTRWLHFKSISAELGRLARRPRAPPLPAIPRRRVPQYPQPREGSGHYQ